MIRGLRQVEGRAACTAVDTQLLGAIQSRHSAVKATCGMGVANHFQSRFSSGLLGIPNPEGKGNPISGH